MNALRDRIDALLGARTEHTLTSRPFGATNTSVFTCACGAEFVPNTWGFETPAHWPSLAEVHVALATVQALDSGRLVLAYVSASRTPVRGATYADVYGQLVRRIGVHRWIAQDGKMLETKDMVSTPLTLVWAP